MNCSARIKISKIRDELMLSNDLLDCNVHLISKKQTDEFYSISEAVLKEIDSYKFGLVANLRSDDINKEYFFDIDNVVVPAKNVLPGDFFIEYFRYYRVLSKIYATKGNHVASAPRFTFQDEVYELSAMNNGGFEKQIPVHSLCFFNAENVVSVVPEKFVQRVLNKLDVKYGEINVLSNNLYTKAVLEPYFYVCESLIPLINNYPSGFAVRKGINKLNHVLSHYKTDIEKDVLDHVRSSNDVVRLVEFILANLDDNLV